MECPICYEVIGEKNCCVTECGHRFCFKCVTKALSVNNSCPCCRAQLLEEEEDDESEYEEEDDDSDVDQSDDEEDENHDGNDESDIDEERRVAQLVSIQELNENIAVIHDRLLAQNYSSNDLMKIILMSMYGYVNDEIYNEFNELGDKMAKSLDKIISDIHKEIRERERESQMFAKEDNIDKMINTCNGLEIIKNLYM